jgi:SPP1 family predicted phage head-tail adaptor
MVTVGQLRNRLTFESDVKVSDGSGGYTTSKVVDFELWGYITKVSAFDNTQAGQEIEYNAVEIWVLYQSDKYPNKQQLVINGDYQYTINAIREINEEHRWVVISATRSILVPVTVISSTTFDSETTTFDNEVLTFDSL